MLLRTVACLLGIACIAFFMSAGTASAKMQWKKDGSLRIYQDAGGLLDRYAERYEYLEKKGVRIVLDGYCYSACTMILAMIPKERVCVTDAADFGFHSVTYEGAGGRWVHDSEATREFVEKYYPFAVKMWIIWNGGLPNAARTSRLIHLRGSELLAVTGYARCAAK